jgi:hypothetical protein
MDEQGRIKAVPQINDWKQQDETVKEIVMVVLRHHNQPSVGHLARFCPDDFDELYDECEAMFSNAIMKDRSPRGL